MSFEKPNYTQVPNALLDAMADMGDAELRCTLAVVRKIIGYHKDGPEPISYSQLETMTGLSRQGAIQGVQDAMARGFIKLSDKKGPRGCNCYEINFDDQSTELTPDPVNGPDQSTELTSTSQLSRPVLVNSADTQKKDSKEKPKEKKAAAGADPNRIAEARSDPTVAAIFSAYENNIEGLTPILVEGLLAAIDEYPQQWLEDAIAEAVRSGVRKWKYIKSILESRKTGGNHRDRSTRTQPGGTRRGQQAVEPRGAGRVPGGAGEAELSPEQRERIRALKADWAARKAADAAEADAERGAGANGSKPDRVGT